MAISVFQNFGFLTPKISKKTIYLMDPKIQNFQNFQKTVTYVIQLLVVYRCAKFQVDSSVFDPKWSVFVSEIMPIYDVFLMRFLELLGVVRRNKWHHYIPEPKLVKKNTFFLSTVINLKILPFLTWPWPDFR